MRILFIGCVSFSKLALLKTLSLEANVVGVITKDESAFNADFEDLSSVAVSNNIPFKYVKDINHPNNVEWIKSRQPDIIFCFGWSSLLKKEILEIAPMGVVGFHPSLLPHNRGRHPLIWAKVLGLEQTGSTFFFIDEGADTGDILSQETVPISFIDTAAVIYDRIVNTALIQIESFLPQLNSGTFSKTRQTEVESNYWRKRGKDDGRIDFRMGTVAICNLVRALSKPYPGAHCLYNGREFKVWQVEPGRFDQNNIEPGKVISSLEGAIEVKTGDGSITITQHEIPEGVSVGSYFSN